MTLRTFVFFCRPEYYIFVNDTRGGYSGLGYAGDLKDCKDAIMDLKVLGASSQYEFEVGVLVEANES